MKLVKAQNSDFDGINTILTRSLREVCSKDYSDEAIEVWCSSREPKQIKEWLNQVKNYFIVAKDESNHLLGVGLLVLPETIKLCYVLPECLNRGIGAKIISRLENYAIRNGARKIKLSSTLTAVGFYEKLGYEKVRPGIALGKIPFMRMKKIFGKNKRV